MCRFLVALGAVAFAPRDLVEAFTRMAEESRSPDGDRQGDGWGIAWLDDGGRWQRVRSLAPIWEDAPARVCPPLTFGIAVHARSASFSDDRGDLEHNQPYLLDGHAFVFNGLLSGVSLPGRRRGEIGAQRIATILGALLRRQPAREALGRLLSLLRERSRRIPALDLAIVGPGEIVALSQFEVHAGYYQLHHAEHAGVHIVCSLPLEARRWRPLPTGRPIALRPATAR
jgi:predicted glutamine amidotransferase